MNIWRYECDINTTGLYPNNKSKNGNLPNLR